MTEPIAEAFVAGLGIYALIGLIVALIFVFGGAGRIDPAAKGMPIRARLLILPGLVGLWPLMILKLFTQSEPPVQ